MCVPTGTFTKSWESRVLALSTQHLFVVHAKGDDKKRQHAVIDLAALVSVSVREDNVVEVISGDETYTLQVRVSGV
jgi:hypothetical protein